MVISEILNRLERVRRTGPDHGVASCPTSNHKHGDRSPSMTWRELPDGRILMKCWAGCSIHEVVSAMGLEISDLFNDKPDDPRGGKHRERRPFDPMDILKVMAFESMLVSVALADHLAGRTPSEKDQARLHLAHERLQEAVNAAHGR